MAASELGGTNPFAGPAGATGPGWARVRRAVRFVAGRAFRMGVSPLFAALWAVAVFGVEPPQRILLVWLAAATLWLPTTVLLARVEFWPAPPDPWLFDVDGTPVADRDVRVRWRSAVVDDSLATLLSLGFVAWTGLTIDGPDPWVRAAIVAALLLFATHPARRLVWLWTQEAALDLLAGRHTRARQRLERLSAVPGFGRTDAVSFHLARARFRDGDLDGALAALDRIRDRRGWSAEALRVQMAIGRDGTAGARALAASLAQDPRRAPVAVAITLLAALHEGRDDEARALADQVASIPHGETRRFAALLLAAAIGGADPVAARRTLDDHGWTPAQARSVAAAWPAVAARLARWM